MIAIKNDVLPLVKSHQINGIIADGQFMAGVFLGR